MHLALFYGHKSMHLVGPPAAPGQTLLDGSAEGAASVERASNLGMPRQHVHRYLPVALANGCATPEIAARHPCVVTGGYSMSVATLSRAASTAVVLVSLAAALPSPARATTFALGVVSAPTDIPVGNEGLRGLFEDDYTFSIGQGSSLAFSAFLETPPSNRFWIGDLNAELFRGSESLVQGTAESGEIPGGGSLSPR